VIPEAEVERLKTDLLRILAEDPHNTRRLLDRLDSLAHESGIDAHSALLLMMTRLAFDEEEARRHWARIVEHQRKMAAALGREPGVRVAVLDYFTNVNRQLVQPTLIDLEMLDHEVGHGMRDARTGLATDRAFRIALQNELRRARRYELRCAVALFDVDDFASANLRHGEVVADRLLREGAMLLGNNVRDIDVAARPGEDEFALLLPETGRGGAWLAAERFRAAFERHFAERDTAAGRVELTVSGGVASYPEDARAPEDLLERAAQALYHAKAAGRNRIEVFRPERRRYLRFELEPGRFEIEVAGAGRAFAARNLSRNGILFTSPEAIAVGDEVEIRLLADGAIDPEAVRVRGTVVRLERLPEPEAVPDATGRPGPSEDRWEVGVAFDLAYGDGTADLHELLDRAHRRELG
jgi:diguanylate cyclase (GGDEF)-like protein